MLKIQLQPKITFSTLGEMLSMLICGSVTILTRNLESHGYPMKTKSINNDFQLVYPGMQIDESFNSSIASRRRESAFAYSPESHKNPPFSSSDLEMKAQRDIKVLKHDQSEMMDQRGQKTHNDHVYQNKIFSDGTRLSNEAASEASIASKNNEKNFEKHSRGRRSRVTELRDRLAQGEAILNENLVFGR